jgi:Domain of unknown function (DUF4440)
VKSLRQLGLLLLLGLTACGHHRIPGTDLEDSSDTRAILDVITKYNAALTARDAAGILQLLDPAFKDNGGTLTPEDDLDYAKMKTVLPQRLARLQDVSVRIEVKAVDVQGDSATAVYTWTSVFKLANKPMTESDIKRMEFRREPEGWKILSGV